MKFNFGDIVVVQGDFIGVIVKCWERTTGKDAGSFFYDVYVRSFNRIIDYKEDEVERFIYNKELLEEEKINYE